MKLSSKLKCVFVLFILIQAEGIIAQRQYEFNRPGNNCNFYYVCFSPDGNYSETWNKPVIYQFGAKGETAMQSFENDELRGNPDVYHYYFVYVPNEAGLECLPALTRINLRHRNERRNNLLLLVNDSTFTQTEMDKYGLSSLFANIQLITEENTFTATENHFASYVNVPTIYEVNAQERSEISAQPIDSQPEVFDFTLSGTIRDVRTGEVLPFASIHVKGTTHGAVTNMDGYFTIRNVPSDTSSLIINYLGYERTTIKLTPGMPKTNLVLEIEPVSITLEGIDIIAEREDLMQISREEIGVIRLSPRNMEQLPNLGEKDIMRTFHLMPGISASNESSSGLYVRGGTPDQNLIVYDGFTIYHVDHLFGFFSAFNSNAIKDVRLHKGGFESRFGERLSSVTEITGKDGNRNDVNIGGDLSLMSVNLFAEVPVGDKFTSLVAFRRSYKGPLYNTIFELYNDEEHSPQSETGTGGGMSAGGFGGGNMPQDVTPSSYFYDLNGKFTYRPNDKDIISFSIFNGTDRLDNGFELDMSRYTVMIRGVGRLESMSVGDLTYYGNFASGLRWSRRWNQKLYSNTTVSYSNYYSERDRLREGGTETSHYRSGFIEDNNLGDLSLRSNYQLDVGNTSQVQFGVFGTNYDIQYNYVQNDTLDILDRQDQGFMAGAFFQSKLKFLEKKIQFTPGIRYTYFDLTGKLYFEPRASVIFNATNNLSINLAYGQYNQFANRIVREDITAGSRDFWILSNNNNIPVSSAVHYITGISYETKNYLFSAEAYYKELKGLSEYTLRFDADFQGISYDENFFTGTGNAKGVEFLVQKMFGSFSGWLSYTLGEVRNRFEIYGDNYFPANQDVTHEFKAVGLYKFRRWNFAATWIYGTGRPYTAPSGSYDVTLLDGTTSSYFTVTNKNGLRLPDYHRMDISVNFKLFGGGSYGYSSVKREGRREIGYIGFSLFNVYNRNNAWYKQYDLIEGEIIETNMNYLGIMPNFTLSLNLR
jgi:ferric enterobactin receptor